jgi:hypothetical protein
VEFLRERGVVAFVVEAGAENDRVPGVELGLEVAEPATLLGSARGVGLRVEPEQYVPASEVGEANRAPGVILRLEIGGGRAGLEHGNLYPDYRRR